MMKTTMNALSLKPLTKPLVRKGPVLNVILDGIASSPHQAGNAVYHARTPCLDWLQKNCLHRSLYAHGHHVGMPQKNDMGNSEVGHNALGAGRIFAQGAKLVQDAITSGALYKSAPWQQLITTVTSRQCALHFLGLLSDGNVHAHIEHLESLVEHAAQRGCPRIYLQLLSDGRDTPPTSALQLIARLEDKLTVIRKLAPASDIRIVSLAGRMVAFMDRYEANWDMVQRGWELVVNGKAPIYPSAAAGITALRQAAATSFNDQYLPPFLIADAKHPVVTIKEHDVVVCFNFRGDRAIELSRAFENRAPLIQRNPLTVTYYGMTLYDGDTQTPKQYLLPPPAINRTMGEYLTASGVKLFALSETQKYGHVTYFWNGNRSQPFSKTLETYIEIKNTDRPFEESPWMKAAEITDAAISAINSGNYRFGRINYPNGDMVGHSGDFNAAILAVEAVDLSLSRLLKAVAAAEGIAIVTADHGNCDEMFALSEAGEPLLTANGNPVPKTSHSIHPVPFFIYDPAYKNEYTLSQEQTLHAAGIANIAATTFMLMGYEAPKDYLPSLIKFT